MKQLLRACIERPVAVTAVCIVLAVASLYASLNMPVTRLPPVMLPRIVVSASMPGLPPKEIRSLVVLPLEDALASVRGVRNMYSVIRSGGALITLEFGWGDSTLAAAGRVREIIDTVYPLLPEGAAKPEVLPSSGEEPLLVYSYSVKGLSLASLRDSGEDELKTAIEQSDGVSRVLVCGGRKREVEIRIDQEKVMARGSSLAAVARAIAEGHTDVPAGEIREAERELVVIARGRCTSTDDLSTLHVLGEEGSFTLGEVAEIRETEKQADSMFLYNGSESVGIYVYRKQSADPLRTSRQIAISIEAFLQTHGSAYSITLVKSAVQAVVEGVSSLFISALLGAGAVFVVLLFLLANVRSGIIVALTIPVSAAVSVIVLSLSGRTLNVLSLGGIAVSIGMISDNAVIVLSALEQAMAKKLALLDRKLTTDEVAEECVATIGSTFGSMITTAVVFIPVLALPGALGILYSDLAIGLVAALVAGWVCSFALVPCLWLRWYKDAPRTSGLQRKRLESDYARLLKGFLRRPVPAMLAGLVFSVIGIALLATRPFEFFPESLARVAVVSVEYPRGTLPETIAERARLLYKELSSLSIDGKQLISAQIMSAGAESEDTITRSLPGYKVETLTIECNLTHGIRLSQAKPFLEKVLEAYTVDALSWSVSAPKDSIKEILSGSMVQGIAVYGATPEEADARALELHAVARTLTEPTKIKFALFPSELEESVVLYPDRNRAAVAGFTASSMAVQCSMASAGSVAGTIELKGRLLPIRLRGTGSIKDSGAFTLSDILKLPLYENESMVQTVQVNKVSMETHQAMLVRSNRKDTRYVIARSGIAGNSSDLREGRITPELQKASASFPWAEDPVAKANVEFARTSLAIVAVVVLLLFLVLAAQFESFGAALLLLLCVPMSLAGAGPMLVLLGINLDSGSILGLVILLGTAVNNAIILYEAARLNSAGYGLPVLAVYKGAILRIRSVTGTTLTTVIALVPMLTALGSTQRSLSAALLGGLIVATLMTIFLYPFIFSKVGLAQRNLPS